jgi:hypothetical protein
VSPEGLSTTVAGTGEAGFSGDGAPATEAKLNAPGRLPVDRAGNLLFGESIYVISVDGHYEVSKNNRIRRGVESGRAGMRGDAIVPNDTPVVQKEEKR